MSDRRGESQIARRLLISTAVGFLAVFVILPLIVVFREAFRSGFAVYFSAISNHDTLAAVKLTVVAAAVSVVANLIFGVAVAWLVVHFRFKGRGFLLSLLDAPLAISPVVVGLMFVLLLGAHGLFGPLLESAGVQVIFATPGVILCTVFITVPYIARELIPTMEQRGRTEEEVSITIGASGWQTLRYVTLPSIKWALLYGIVLCNARAMGEFGAVSVVSGHIRGETNTLPLHIEILYNEYKFAAAFAVSSLLALLAIATLIVKSFMESRQNET